MYNVNLGTFYCFCDECSFKPWMTKPFIIDDDIYATDGKILIRFNGCAKDFPKITEQADKPYIFTGLFNDKPTGYMKISVDKLKSLLNSIEPVDEIIYEEKETTCENCDGSGFVDFVYEAIDGEKFYKSDACPVCEGTGKIFREVEVKTGKKVIPYNTSFVHFYHNGFSNTVNAGLLLKIVKLCEEIDVPEFYFGLIDHTKMIVNLNDYIEIVVMCCMESNENTLEYKN